MKKPESIVSVNIDVLVGISSYDAFVYEYTNIENGKKYVGSHLGEVGDGYWHSSRNLEFIDLFSDMIPIFEYKILDVGSFDEMKNLEAKIHKDNKVVSNPLYYNLAAAGSAFKVPVSTTKSIRRLLESQGLKRLSFQTPNVRLRQKRNSSVLDLCRFDLGAANNLSNRTPHHSTHSL